MLPSRDAILSGASAGEAPVRIDEAEARLNGSDGITIESLTVRGPALSVDLNGVLAPSADPRGLKIDIQASNTAVRHALKVWPEAVASKVRRFLVANLKGGTVERIGVKVAMSGADMDAAVRRRTDSRRGGEPRLRPDRCRVHSLGWSSSARSGDGKRDHHGPWGDRPSSKASSRWRMGGRSPHPKGSLSIDDYWPGDAVAQIDFRLRGGADGFGRAAPFAAHSRDRGDRSRSGEHQGADG